MVSLTISLRCPLALSLHSWHTCSRGRGASGGCDRCTYRPPPPGSPLGFLPLCPAQGTPTPSHLMVGELGGGWDPDHCHRRKEDRSVLQGTLSASPHSGLPRALLARSVWVGLPSALVLSLTLNWRRRLAISYSRCSSIPRRRHHLREFLLRSDFTWVEVQMPGIKISPAGGGDGG